MSKRREEERRKNSRIFQAFFQKFSLNFPLASFSSCSASCFRSDGTKRSDYRGKKRARFGEYRDNNHISEQHLHSPEVFIRDTLRLRSETLRCILRTLIMDRSQRESFKFHIEYFLSSSYQVNMIVNFFDAGDERARITFFPSMPTGLIPSIIVGPILGTVIIRSRISRRCRISGICVLLLLRVHWKK